MAYTIELKNEAKERLRNGEKANVISEQMGISLSTIYKWKKEIQAEKIENIEELKIVDERKERKEREEIKLSMQIKKLIKASKFKEAISLCDRYPDNPTMQGKKMKILINLKKYNEARKIGNKEEFVNNSSIQAQMMMIEIKKGNLEKAKQIGNREGFQDKMSIQSQMIIIAIKEGDLEKAKEIGNREKFINHETIQSQMITIAIMEGDLEKAKEIGNREEFKNNEIIQEQMKSIESNEKFSPINEDNIEEDIINIDRNQLVNRIRTKLYYDKIEQGDIEEIKNSEFVSEYEKNCILLAIYEKTKNVQKAKQLVKKYKEENPDSKDIKTFNIIMQRIESKKIKIFDFTLYDKLLKWEFDKELEEEYKEELRKESDKKREQKMQIRKEATQVVTGSKKVFTETKTTETVEKPVKKETLAKKIKVVNPQQEKTVQEKVKKESTHFNEIVEYLKEKRKEIYVKLQSKDWNIQRKAQEQWDKMEILLDRVENSREDKEYLNNLYEKILILKEKEEKLER